MRRITQILPILGILTLEIILFVTNYTPGTILAGWDNLMPEFNFWQNLERSLIGVWQQYRGLGLFDGQSHAASLVHTLVIGLLSLIQPQSLVRYTFTFGIHALGIIGVFYLVKELLGQSRSKYFIAGIAALFYGFNPATIQMFYTPFEPFTIHFAALPWTAYGLIEYFNGKHKAWAQLLIILLLSTPQYFVPTLLIPTGILLSSFCLMHIRTSRRQVVALIIGFLLINSFWLLPYLAGLHTNAPVIAGAKINQMSTSDIYQRDQAFGDGENVMLLHGFPLAFEDFDKSGAPIFVMANWRSYLNLPIVQVAGWLMASLSLMGLTISLIHRKKHITPFIACGILAFIFLATDTPVVREINTAIRTAIPFVGEGLRVPFTKFILLFVLSYSVCIAVSVEAIWEYLQKNTLLRQGTVFLVSLALIVLAFPAFTGEFISPLMRVQLPNEYPQLFAYFRKQPTAARVAILPQPAYWSWKLYQFGYHGSGFMWFGIPQAILDRAFDPWSSANEEYYWELSYALYSKNAALLSSVINKYDIDYIVLDENILSFSNNRALFTDETKALLAQLPNIIADTSFGKITVYKRIDNTNQSFISIKDNLPIVNGYLWTDNDVPYEQLGDYITESHPLIAYPFRSLFTKRSVSERNFTIKETPETIDINSTVIATSASILKDHTIAYDSTKSSDLTSGNVKECGLLKDGKATASDEGGVLLFRSINQRGCLSFDIPTLSHKFGYLVAVESQHVAGRPLMISFINDTARHVELETYLPDDPTGILRQAQDTWQTTYFILPPLAPDGLGYTVYVSNDSIGRYETINDLKQIRVYTIPYEAMVHLNTFKGLALQGVYSNFNFSVSHPNPAWYSVKLTTDNRSPATLILSQSYDPGWIAWSDGKMLDHVNVDNWKNGWTIDPSTTSTIYIFFWPQLLEFLGFALLPLPFILKL